MQRRIIFLLTVIGFNTCSYAMQDQYGFKDNLVRYYARNIDELEKRLDRVKICAMQDSKGMTLLMRAVQNGYVDDAKRLAYWCSLKTLSLVNNGGKTAEQLACGKEFVDFFCSERKKVMLQALNGLSNNQSKKSKKSKWVRLQKAADGALIMPNLNYVFPTVLSDLIVDYAMEKDSICK